MNWYKRQLKIARQIKKPVETEDVIKNKKEILKMLEEGYSKRDIANLFNISPTHLVRILQLPVSSVKSSPNRSPVSSEEIKKMIRLYSEEGLKPADIADRVNRPMTTVVDILKRKEIYKPTRKSPIRFRPTEEEIKKIDYWYALPPQGEGRSLMWIAEKMGVSGEHVRRWFHKTGRPVRSFQEQVSTQSTRDDTSLAALLRWEKIGKLKGFLENYYSNRQQSIDYLNGYVNRLIQMGQSTDIAFSTRSKYMKIIENHTYPNEMPQQVPQQENINELV